MVFFVEKFACIKKKSYLCGLKQNTCIMKSISLTISALLLALTLQAETSFTFSLTDTTVTVTPSDNTTTYWIHAQNDENNQVQWNQGRNYLMGQGYTEPCSEASFDWKIYRGWPGDELYTGEQTFVIDELQMLNNGHKPGLYDILVAGVDWDSKSFTNTRTTKIYSTQIEYYDFHFTPYFDYIDSVFLFLPSDNSVEYAFTVFAEADRAERTNEQVLLDSVNSGASPLVTGEHYIDLTAFPMGVQNIVYSAVKKEGSEYVLSGQLVWKTFRRDNGTTPPGTDPKPDTDSDYVVVDTLMSFYSTYVQPELDPNNHEYVYTIYTQDSTYKVQVDYFADSQFGTFTDQDFRLSGSGNGYNYLRRVASDMEVYLFVHLDATVSEDEAGTHITLNGLVSKTGDKKRLSRVLVSALLPSFTVKDTTDITMDHAYVTYYDLYHYFLIETKNEEYSLRLGLMGTELKAGTYYTADMLMPELKNLSTGKLMDFCNTCDQTMLVEDEEDYHRYTLSLISDDLHLFRIVFDDDVQQIVTTDTVSITCWQTTMDDLSDLYDVYLFSGEDADYTVRLALHSDAVDANQFAFAPTDFSFQFTQLYRNSSSELIALASATGMIEDLGNGKYNMYADLVGKDAVLYRVTMPMGYSTIPEANDTIYLDFGNSVGRIDYSQGLGYVGYTASLVDEYDMHVSFYYGGTLDGEISGNFIDYEGTYITQYTDTNIVFEDVTIGQIMLDSVDNDLHFTADFYTTQKRLYHVTMVVEDKEWLRGQEVNVDYAGNTAMVALRLQQVADTGLYVLQLQHAEAYDATGEPIGDSQLYNFNFVALGSYGIAGEYGYSEGNLNPNYPFVITENGCEIYLGPYAGTLHIECLAAEKVRLGGQIYNTYWYSIDAAMLAHNMEIYELHGSNVLICMDPDGNLVEVDEELGQAIIEDHAARGERVRKVLENGQLYLETDNGRYSVMGSSLR